MAAGGVPRRLWGEITPLSEATPTLFVSAMAVGALGRRLMLVVVFVFRHGDGSKGDSLPLLDH